MSETNEHADYLRRIGKAMGNESIQSAAAEIERLAARVRELESEVSDEDGVKVRLNCPGCKISFLERIPVAKLELWAERHYGTDYSPVLDPPPESKPDQETKPSVQHTCGLPWTLPKLRGIADPPCPACASPPPSRSQP